MRSSFLTIFGRTLTLVPAIAMALGVPIAHAITLQGMVQSGGTVSIKPIPQVAVTLFEATASRPNQVGHAISDSSGKFSVQSPASESSSVFYLDADLGSGLHFVSVLGSVLPPYVAVNELTTVAASYSMAQFYKTGAIAGRPSALKIAAAMNENLVSPETGQSSPVLLGSPNGDETISLRVTRSLANLLAGCTAKPARTASLFSLTSVNGSAPSNTAEALANLARNPGQNAVALYRLATMQDLYSPALAHAPDVWTIAVKVNDSGDDNNLFGGPARLVFDSKGYGWVTNNVVQGKTYSSRTLMVLQPNGRPSDGRDGTPVSPIIGGGTLGGAFGITIDPHQSVWTGNFGWGLPVPLNIPGPGGNGSVSQFSPSGDAISPATAYQGGPVRAQGLASDKDGNIWICSNGTDSVYVFLNGNPKHAISFQQYSGSAPFDIAIAADGTAWVSNGGGFNGGTKSSIAKYKLSNGTLTQQFIDCIGDALKGLSLDSKGNAWVASQNDNTIYGIRPDGTVIGGFTGGGINGPWDVTVDGDDNLWVTNFGPLQLFSNFSDGRLSKLCGITLTNCPANAVLGTAISPSSGYTMPTAGSPVLLHNGDPLYGPGALPSFAPMMRQTSSSIDQAGNVWSINNWKPDFNIDLLLNPGGDGILIFVGLATPPAARQN